MNRSHKYSVFEQAVNIAMAVLFFLLLRDAWRGLCWLAFEAWNFRRLRRERRRQDRLDRGRPVMSRHVAVRRQRAEDAYCLDDLP